MKRSKLVSDIFIILHQFEHHHHDETAEVIMRTIEEAGMLPPYRYQDEPLATRSNKLYHRVWDREDGKNDWEEEDEE